MKKPTSGEKGVSRIDNESKNTHGWYVRVCFDRKMHSKFFGDGTHGGKEKAFKKAVKYRDALEKELGKPRTDRIVVVSNFKSRLGINGVQRVYKEAQMKNNPLKGLFFEVSWSPEPNQLRKKLFSAEGLGEEAAFYQAVRFRQKCERQMYGRIVHVEIPPYEEVKRRWEAVDRKRKREAQKAEQ